MIHANEFDRDGRFIRRWSVPVSLTRAEWIRRIAHDMDENPEQNAAALTLVRTDQLTARRLCPSGLIDDAVLPLCEIESQMDRTKSVPFTGGAMEQPSRVLDGVRVIAHRRALHQRRTYAKIRDDQDRAARDARNRPGGM